MWCRGLPVARNELFEHIRIVYLLGRAEGVTGTYRLLNEKFNLTPKLNDMEVR